MESSSPPTKAIAAPAPSIRERFFQQAMYTSSPPTLLPPVENTVDYIELPNHILEPCILAASQTLPQSSSSSFSSPCSPLNKKQMRGDRFRRWQEEYIASKACEGCNGPTLPRKIVTVKYVYYEFGQGKSHAKTKVRITHNSIGRYWANISRNNSKTTYFTFLRTNCRVLCPYCT
jgi:hypothetical protein